MAQTLNLRCRGLITNPNSLDEAQVNGALAIADNIVIDKDNLAESRRGFTRYGQYLDVGNYTDTIEGIFNYKEDLLVSFNNKIARDSKNNDPWIEYTGTFTEPASDFKIRSLQQNENFYITTNDGIKKLDKIDGQFTDAGMVRSLDGFGQVTGSTGWFTDNASVAYRMVWAKYDANNNLILGAPSSRVVVGNSTGNSVNVSLSFLVPDEVTTDYFYQIYRSPLTGSILDEPTDELQLVKEGKPSSGEVVGGEFTILDDLVDDLKGATLYTSPSQQGIVASNEQPPYAKDFALFKNHVFYANTKTKHRLTLTLIGVSGGGFNIGDEFVIDGITYTGAVAEDPNNEEFLVSNSSSPSIAIDETALSLVRVINKSSLNTGIYAYYLSGFEDVPGKILFERRALSGGSFTATSTKGTAFNPEIPSTGTNNDNVSDNEVKQNRVYISKPQQPEAVPLFSYLDIGTQNQPIKRIIALRDGLYIFKGDGVFKITGENLTNFKVSLFDNNLELLAPESAVTFNNSVFCMTLQGVVSVSDSGIAVVSRPIEQQLLRLIQYPNFNNTTFGISYESERKYILFCVASSTQDYPTQAFVYNSFTNAWTRWTLTATCGFINKADDRMYFGGKLIGYDVAWVYRERKTFSNDDYVDDDSGTIITEVISPTKLRLIRSEEAVVGYWIRQYIVNTGTYALAKITAVDTATSIITVSPANANWSSDPTNPTNIYKPITCRIKWVGQTAGNPGVVKHFREGTLFFRQDQAAELKIGYETNFQPGYEATNVLLINAGNWGDFDWGTIPWNGLDDTFSQPIRVGIPRNKQMCLWISMSVEGTAAFSSFTVAGISTQFEVISERYQWKP